MKNAKLLRLISIWFLVLSLSFMSPASVSLPVAGSVGDAIVSAENFTSNGNKDDIARIDIVYYDKAFSAASTSGAGYSVSNLKWATEDLPIVYAFNKKKLPRGLDATVVKGILGKSAETWDSETIVNLFKDSVGDTTSLYGKLDGTNTIAFGLTSKGTIAVTTFWYYTATGQIVEFDMLFNTLYKWGDADLVLTKVMDIQNIATHEFGHTFGLGDIYDNNYNYVTMFGYANYDEIQKRTLEAEDIAGLELLYGQ